MNRWQTMTKREKRQALAFGLVLFLASLAAVLWEASINPGIF